MKLDDLVEQVLEWGADRGILDHSDPKTQTLKCVSEVGELADHVAEGSDVRDDIGDVLVTLVLLANLSGTTLQECLGMAYAEIAKRRGRMVNGTFVKERDNPS